MSLVHIAGYVIRNDEALDELFGHTKFYFAKYSQFTKSLDRSDLKVLTDQAGRWTFFCFIPFRAVITEVCRKSLSNFFKDREEFYDFNIKDCHCHVLSNVKS